ncbi:tigger transposable element-derived protein 6-like [Bemisia tabaci]|uniref:tigger transposable element-derived protein 6-like n=1 Tax=Bemisia tabaci TaxID=7038 RepID=UPI003B283BC2
MRKCSALSVAQKVSILEAVKNRGAKTKEQIAKEFGIPPSTLSTILKNEEKILELSKSDGARGCKRKRESEFSDVEECLVVWIKQCRDKNVSIDGALLKEKATFFAESRGHANFRASNGWMANFKKRSGLTFKKVCGESASVDDGICISWKGELRNLIASYSPDNVFNADETGLFFKCMPDKTLTFKEEKCHGGKHSKERITVLLAVNSTGTYKVKPLILGKSKKPRCFAGCKSLPTDYDSNRKAWMTSSLFCNWLHKLDKQMISEKRNILLLIDNCTAHNVIPPLQAVRVEFLPPNTTSKLQPLDRGIIKNLKTLYRKEVVRRILSDIESGVTTNITVLDAMRMIDKSWRNVKQSTIRNCFKSCGFISDDSSDSEPTGEDNELAEWDSLGTHFMLEGCSFEDFVAIDNEVAVTGLLSDEDILASVSADNNEEIDEEDDEPLVTKPVVPNKQAKSILTTLRDFVEQLPNVSDDVFSALVTLENEVDRHRLQHLQQSRITQFFKI